MFFELEALRGLAPGAWQTSLGPVAASLFWVRSPGGPLECERVGVLLPDAAAPSSKPYSRNLLRKDPVDSELRLRSGGGGATTELLCGAFALEGSGHHPLLSAFPSVTCISGSGERPPPWLTVALDLVTIEVHSSRAGGAVVLEPCRR